MPQQLPESLNSFDGITLTRLLYDFAGASLVNVGRDIIRDHYVRAHVSQACDRHQNADIVKSCLVEFGNLLPADQKVSFMNPRDERNIRNIGLGEGTNGLDSKRRGGVVGGKLSEMPSKRPIRRDEGRQDKNT